MSRSAPASERWRHSVPLPLSHRPRLFDRKPAHRDHGRDGRRTLEFDPRLRGRRVVHATNGPTSGPRGEEPIHRIDSQTGRRDETTSQSDKAGNCQRGWVTGCTKLTGRGTLWLLTGVREVPNLTET